MNEDQDNIIDVEAVEIVDTPNLPAVVDDQTHGSATPIEGRDWSRYSRPERRCKAHSSRTGEQCKNAAIKGGKVCRYHGGNAPHVIANARARLQNAADLMARELLGIALTGDTDTVKLAAIRDALDRAGLRPPSEVVLSQAEPKPYETIFDSIGGSFSEASEPLVEGRCREDEGPHASPASAYDPAGQMSEGYGRTDTSGYDDLQPEYVGRQSDPASSTEGDDVLGRDGTRQPAPRSRDRDTPPQPPGRHITGWAAIVAANEANRQVGALPPQRAIESPHKRYPRP